MDTTKFKLLIYFTGLAVILVQAGCGPAAQGPMVPRQSPLTPGMPPSNIYLINNNTAFFPAGGPYNFTQTVYITDTATLTVYPGTVLNFTPGSMLYVDGGIVLSGTASDPILVRTLDTGQNWGGFIFGKKSTGGNLTATYISDAFVQINGGSVSMDDCTIENGVWIPEGDNVGITISHSVLSSFDGFAFSVKQSSFPANMPMPSISIVNTVINGMMDFALYGLSPSVASTAISISSDQINGGIFLHGGGDITGFTFSISGNNITGSIGVAQPMSTSTIDPFITSNNIVNSNGYAVYGGGQLYNNYIAGNNGAGPGVVDTTQGGLCDNTMDENSAASPPQLYRVDCVVNVRTSPN